MKKLAAMLILAAACGPGPLTETPSEGGSCDTFEAISCSMDGDSMICVNLFTWKKGDFGSIQLAPRPGQLTWVKFERRC